MTHARLLIECSEGSLTAVEPGRSTIETLEALKQVALSDYGVSAQFVIYQGMASFYGGGRVMASLPEDVVHSANVLNEHGISFSVALNGGLTLPGEIELDSADVAVLSALDDNNRRYAVENMVIVTHEKLLGYIRSRHPSLKVVASCIQAVNPRLRDGYARRLREYDSVVFMNQHTTAEYLRQYAAHASKIIVFLSIRCGNDDLTRCYAHYAEVELQYGKPEGRLLLPSTELPSFEQSVLPDDGFGCLLANEFRPRVSLLNREDDLSKILQMGVSTYKIPRLSLMDWEMYNKLLGLARQHLRPHR